MPSRFFLRFSLNALRYRRQRLLLAFGALAVAAALATVMFGIYASVANRVRNEFRGYGANLIAVGANGGAVPLEMVAAAERLGAQAEPVLVTSYRVPGAGENGAIPVAGVGDVSSYSYWHVQGDRRVEPGVCLAGELLAERLQLGVGSSIAGGALTCRVAGIVSTGGTEDQELIVDFASAAALSGIHDAASVVEIQTPGERLDAIRTALAAQFPAADVRTVRAVAGTETNVVVKMRAVLLLLTLVILAITTLCVTSNFSEMVLERSKEIGIMKALGGAELQIAEFFVSESVALAFVATIAGYTVGIFGVAAIGRDVFGGAFRLEADWRVLAGVAVVMLLVASAATAVATARIWSIEPASILRGE